MYAECNIQSVALQSSLSLSAYKLSYNASNYQSAYYDINLNLSNIQDCSYAIALSENNNFYLTQALVWHMKNMLFSI